MEGDFELITILLSRGASVHVRDIHSNSALHLACEHCHMPDIRNLIPIIGKYFHSYVMVKNGNGLNCIEILENNRSNITQIQFDSLVSFLQQLLMHMFLFSFSFVF